MWLERMLPLLGSFREEVIMITGASSGIGRETALMLARQGASVALAARGREQLEVTADAVADAGGRALVVPTDVTDPRSVRAAVRAVKRKWERIDCLVNNAGIMLPGLVTELTVSDLDAMLRVNVVGALLMMQAVLPVMRSEKRGTIINVASLAGRRGMTPLGGYCATKFALVGLTEALRTELDGTRIHVGLVLPGVVDTPMAQGFDQDTSLSTWPSALNMPAAWVAAAILLAARLRLTEISVPPGAATVEKIGALVPGLTDTLISWMRAAGAMLAGGGTAPAASRKRRARK